jgi:hypothetical protein
VTVNDPTTAVFNEIVFGRRTQRNAVDGPQQGVVSSVSGSTCYFTIPSVSTDFAYGPAPVLPGLTVAAGDDVLVVFVGDGVKNPWVVGGAGTGVSSVFGRTGAVAAVSGDYTAAEVTNAADKSAATTQAFTGEVQAPTLAATGAGTTGRYIGATNGQPAGGPWLTDDFANDPTNGCFWICTASGSPGTWAQVGTPRNGDVPIGALVYSTTGPGIAYTINGNGAAQTPNVWSFTFPVINGHQYKMDISGEIDTSGSGTAVYMNTVINTITNATVDRTGFLVSTASTPPGVVVAPCAGSRILTATATGNSTVELQGGLDAPTGYAATWPANGWEVNLIRVA